jgi:hypothetical protein
MERQSHNKMGESGYYHFYGVVENRKDPLSRGRVQVRIFGDHTEDLAELPTESLSWAQVILPVTATPNSSHNLWDGTLVSGYYADGIEKQVPIITGQLAKNGETTLDAAGVKTSGFSDQRESKDCSTSTGATCASVGINTSPVANPDKYNDSQIKKTRKDTQHKISGGKAFNYTEPEGNYKAKYPFNRASETESGHIIEYDDTPGEERINISHRTGSYVEMLKDGSVVYKATSNKHDVTNGNTYQSTSGSSSTNVSGVTINQHGGNYIMNVSGNVNMTVSGNVTQQVSGSYTGNFGGTYNVTAGTINMKAGTINLN